jgi:uncharacterized protein YjbJ (UPF0337 family)
LEAIFRGGKKQWGKLTDDDLLKILGKREHLEGKLQERCGYGKDKFREEVDDWGSRVSPVEYTKGLREINESKEAGKKSANRGSVCCDEGHRRLMLPFFKA